MLAALLSTVVALPPWGGGLVVLLAKATLILVAALGITRTMQRASAGARHLVWLVTLGTLLFVPALTGWAPLRIRVFPAANATSHVVGLSSMPVPQRIDQFSPPLAGGGSAAASDHRTDAATPHDYVVTRALVLVRAMRGISLILAIWAAVALLIVGVFVRSGLIVRRIVRHAQPLESQSWRTPLLEVADRMGLDEPPRLLRSSHTKMPFACGVVTPTIVLPDDCDGWSLDLRRAVLLHELAHVRRNDLLGHMLGRLVAAFYWFHPLVWMAAKRLRAESERACDDLALTCGTRATDYAEHLLDIVTSVRKDGTPSVALAMARRKEFEGRLLAILDPALRHSSLNRRQSAVLIGSLALLAGVVAAIAPVPRAASAATVRVARDVRSTASAAPPPAIADARATAHGNNARHIQVNRAAEFSAPPPRVSITTNASRGDTVAADDRPILLAKVLRGDSSATLRRIAAWGLQEYTDASSVAVDALVGAVRHDGDASVREMAAWALAGDRDLPDVTDALGAALRGDANERVRATAAWALGTLGAKGSAEPLTAALSDTSPKVRTRAAWALGNVDTKQAPKALLALLRDGDDKTRTVAAWALFQIQDPASLPALEAALRTESDEDIRLADIRAIAAMGDQSVDALRGLLESPDTRIRSMAVRALAGGHAAGPWPWPWPDPRPNP